MSLKDTRKACKITDNIFKRIIELFPKFKTEKDIESFIKKQARLNKVKLAFPSIIASGKHASNPHHKPTKQKLQKGFCVMDFGIRVNGYCSDMTRTVFIGNPTKREKTLYNLVLNCQKSCIKKIKLGNKYKDLDLGARKFLKNHKKCFIHGLGHGVGKRIHQSPKISPKSKDLIKIRDVITIEPGLYFKKKLGIRIEDTIVIKKDKSETLTHSTKKLIIF